MLLKKTILESRTRLVSSCGMLLLLTLFFVWSFGGKTVSAGRLSQSLVTLAGILLPMAAVLMAGNGISPQNAFHASRGFQSVLYMISMPVRRRTLLLLRFAVSAGGFLIQCILTFVIYLAFFKYLGHDYPVEFLPQDVLGAYFWGIGFLGLSTLLSTFFDEYMHVTLSVFLVVGISLLAVHTNFFRTLELANNWPLLASSVLVGMACLLLSMYFIERQEY